jgi:hypothetical protein
LPGLVIQHEFVQHREDYEMAITFYELRRNLGLAGGCLWLVTVGTVYAAWSLLTVRSALATSLLAAMCIFAAGMYFFGIAMIRGVRQLPFLPADRPSEGRRISSQFAMIVAAEGAAIAAVSVACERTHHWRFIVPLILIIVGLHFLPLARLFAVPRYYVTGALFCAIPIVTMVSIPASAHVGHALSWITIPAVGCALVSLGTAWAGLNEVRRFVGVSRAQV